MTLLNLLFKSMTVLLAIAFNLKGFAGQPAALPLPNLAPDTTLKLDDYMTVVPDPAGQLTAATVLKKWRSGQYPAPISGQKLNFGVNKTYPFWALFAVDSQAATKQLALLEHNYSATDRITMHHLGSSGKLLQRFDLGDKLPFWERPLHYRHPVFQLELVPGLNYFMVEVNTASIVRLDLLLHHPDSFQNQTFVELFTYGSLLGGVLFIIIYNFFLYISTREKSYGLYVCYAMAYFVYFFGFFGFIPYLAFGELRNAPMTGWDLYLTIDVATIFCVLFTNHFLHLREESRFFYRTLNVFAWIATINLFANTIIFQGSIAQLKSLSLFTIFLMGFVLVAAGFRSMQRGYKPARYFTFALSCLIVSNIIGLAANLGFIPPGLISKWGQLVGVNLEMVFLSFALGARINVMKADKARAERLLLHEAEEKKKLQAELIESQKENIANLDEQVKEKTQEVRDIMVHINQGIFTIDKTLTLGEEFSSHLTSLLGQERLTGQNIKDVLLDHSNLSEDEKARLMTSLEFSFGEDKELTWDTNADALVHELMFELPHSSFIMEIEWWPIVDDFDQVCKVLVTLRDVTELRELRLKAEQNEKKGNMLLEILSNDLVKSQKFIDRSLRSWGEVDKILVNFTDESKDNCHRLFRVFHTIKGNARTFGFSSIADLLHELETSLKQLNDRFTAQGIDTVRSQSNEARELLQEYQQIFADKFSQLVEPSEGIAGQLFESYMVSNLIPKLSRIAKECDKPVPRVKISNPDGFLIMNDEIEDIFENILNHLLRNSIDHGIESVEERQVMGKQDSGLIEIDIKIDRAKTVQIDFCDDGRGLNLAKVYRIGVSKNILAADCSLQCLIEAIFTPGFSTAEKTTMISGRGVGMDAVRHYARALGAELVIEHEVIDEQQILKAIQVDQVTDLFVAFRFKATASLMKMSSSQLAS